MKAVLMSIQPYWVFLIIAKKMGWNINQEKTIEVRKNYPKDGNWNKVAKIYCSKDKKSFAKIPKEYQPLMERLLGKVIGEFVCDKVDEYRYGVYDNEFVYHIPTAEGEKTCMEYAEAEEYGNGKPLYFWHISNLVIYGEPKELGEFLIDCKNCGKRYVGDSTCWQGCMNGYRKLTRPPQSWCYVEGVN